MITFSKIPTRPNYLFNQLPHYFAANDSYKPNSMVGYTQAGFVERFLEALCMEVDAEVSPYIDSLGYLFDATGLSNLPHSDFNKFLIHLSDSMGNPPDISDEAKYQILLRYLRVILQAKGTRLSLDMYLALFHYKVDHVDITPYNSPIYDKTPTPYKYDNGVFYDTQSIFYFDLALYITGLDGLNPGDPGSGWLQILKDALNNFIMPIHINLTSITYITESPLPVVETLAAIEITSTSAKLRLGIISLGASTITEAGYVYSVNEDLAIPNSTRTFTSGLVVGNTLQAIETFLETNTLYYFKAFATNSEGTVYGELLTFITLS